MIDALIIITFLIVFLSVLMLNAAIWFDVFKYFNPRDKLDSLPLLFLGLISLLLLLWIVGAAIVFFGR
jgi:hypothetical protein